MHIVLEATRLDITVPVVVGLVFFLILVTGLGFVRQVGAFRPHSDAAGTRSDEYASSTDE